MRHGTASEALEGMGTGVEVWGEVVDERLSKLSFDTLIVLQITHSRLRSLLLEELITCAGHHTNDPIFLKLVAIVA